MSFSRPLVNMLKVVSNMTQEDRELLLKDLCARLPYGVEVFYSETVPISTLKTINAEKGDCIVYDHTQWYRHTKFRIETIKPYLRPMSSMTEEEVKTFKQLQEDADEAGTFEGDMLLYDWLNKNHFDYRLLIFQGLALEAPAGMYI